MMQKNTLLYTLSLWMDDNMRFFFKKQKKTISVVKIWLFISLSSSHEQWCVYAWWLCFTALSVFKYSLSLVHYSNAYTVHINSLTKWNQLINKMKCFYSVFFPVFCHSYGGQWMLFRRFQQISTNWQTISKSSQQHKNFNMSKNSPNGTKVPQQTMQWQWQLLIVLLLALCDKWFLDTHNFFIYGIIW